MKSSNVEMDDAIVREQMRNIDLDNDNKISKADYREYFLKTVELK